MVEVTYLLIQVVYLYNKIQGAYLSEISVNGRSNIPFIAVVYLYTSGLPLYNAQVTYLSEISDICSCSQLELEAAIT